MNSGTKFFGLLMNTRSKRRLLVAITYASYIALCFLSGSMRSRSGLSATVGFIGSAVAGLLLCAGWLTLVRLLREYGFPGDSRLFTSRDERQTVVRHHAFVRAYWVVSALICFAGVYWMVATSAGLWLPGSEYRKPILFGLFFLCSSLPSVIIAWTELDIDRDAILFGKPSPQM